mmetsp:Transcript_18648/g.46156  ORF Transcript_18648/g.46156 Transcript_18648/m.46156 type:complete len:401 (+) Transcript_18648:66-1268(+)|eukprot:CAMPEP_0113625946 /NCGR_PEP_ID=MMETSP0017_2-20120614/13410_1 /TAXON_ID=2856 /ORGANISM="Cylindrotheca closterium" /LENGTH=400 /DNA_ID=CAMNT_0000536093 /DNA_START=66 /DNA_END=1268 /DNA_ORIENTATION=+ /assembly_acc=CAM_ASM_000147
MQSPSLKCTLWLVLLLHTSVESSSWQRRPLGHPSIQPRQSSYTYLQVRGGDEIPKVPEDVNPRILHPDVSRGGSTKAERYPGGVTIYTPIGGTSATVTAPKTDTDIATTSDSVITTIETEIAETEIVPEAKLSKKEKKKHKKHKQIAKKLKSRNATNFRRKVLHACFGFFFAGLNHFIPKAKFVPGMVVLTTGCLTMELLRYRKGFGWMNEVLHKVLGSSLRKHEMDGKFTGSFYYFLGVTVTAALYPTSCATLGICQLAIADPTASYFGRQTRHIYWSRIENGLGGFGRNKGMLGFLGGAIACVPMNYRLLSLAKFGHAVTRTNLLTASFALGLAGAFADLAVPTPTLTLPKRIRGVRVPPFHVDDNLVVPVFAGYACKKIFEALQWSADLDLAKFLVI